MYIHIRYISMDRNKFSRILRENNIEYEKFLEIYMHLNRDEELILKWNEEKIWIERNGEKITENDKNSLKNETESRPIMFSTRNSRNET